MLVSGRGESRKALVLKPVQDTVQALGKLHMHSVPRAANPNSTKGFKLRVDTSPSGDGEELSVLHFLRHLCLVHSTVWLFPSVVQRGGSSTLLWEQPPRVLGQGPGVLLVSLFTSSFLPTAPAQAQIIYAGQACVVKEDNISERVYTIREGDTLVLQCLVTGHPRPQVSFQPGLSAGCPASSYMLESSRDAL